MDNAGIGSVMIVLANRFQAQHRVRFKAIVQHQLQHGIAHAWTGVDSDNRQELSGKLIALPRDSENHGVIHTEVSSYGKGQH